MFVEAVLREVDEQIGDLSIVLGDVGPEEFLYSLIGFARSTQILGLHFGRKQVPVFVGDFRTVVQVWRPEIFYAFK